MINWKIRFKNREFFIQLIVSIISSIFAYMGITASEITSWYKLFEIIRQAFSNPYIIFIMVISIYNFLIDISLDSEFKDIILNLSRNYSEIQKLDAISSTPVGYRYIVVLTIYVDGNMSTFDSHSLADKFEKDVNSLDNIYKAIVHVNPI